MKISIVGGGNMGGAIARGLSTCDLFRPQDITVINRRASNAASRGSCNTFPRNIRI